MNNLYFKLKFEIEKLEIILSGYLFLLFDFKVIIFKDGKSFFEFYKKIVKKLIFVYY